MFDSYEINMDEKSNSNKETYLRNELSRLIKENTSLRVSK